MNRKTKYAVVAWLLLFLAFVLNFSPVLFSLLEYGTLEYILSPVTIRLLAASLILGIIGFVFALTAALTKPT